MKLIATNVLAEKLVMSVNETETLLQMLDFSSTDISLLASCRAAIFKKLDGVAQELAEKMPLYPELAQLISDISSPEAFPKAVRDFLRDYFGGSCDEAYINSRTRLGALFFRFDVPPKVFLPLSTYLQHRLEVEIIQIVGKTDAGMLAAAALRKYMRLDNLLITTAFLHAKLRAEAAEESKLGAYAAMLEKKVERLTQSLEDMSQKDTLTGLYNPRGFYDNLYRELSNAKRHKWAVCVVYFDFNGFREFNETEGRRVGDKLLNIMAATLADTYRETDILCRYRGDEFCVIMPNTVASDARKVCKRVIEKFRQRSTYGLAFCIGLAQTGSVDFMSADDLLYTANENVKIAQSAITDKSEFFLKG